MRKLMVKNTDLIAVAAILFLASAATMHEPARLDEGEIALAVYKAMNEARVRFRAKPLELDEALRRAAERHAVDMAENGFFSHIGSDGSTVAERVEAEGGRWRRLGEVLVMFEGVEWKRKTPGEIAEAAVGAWLRSARHMAELVNSLYTHVGVGVAIGRDKIIIVAVYGGNL